MADHEQGRGGAWSRRRQRAEEFWSSDWSLRTLLILLVGNIFTLPLVGFDLWGRLVARAIFSLIIISGVVATVRSRLVVLVAAVFTAGILWVGWKNVEEGTPRLHVANDVAALIFIALFVVLLLRQVFRDGPITMRRVEGAVAIYLLLGLMWGLAYELVELLSPASFNIGQISFATAFTELSYFSFTTLTTVGFGDILPVNPVARALAVLEALVGQLFPVVLIARLVAMELAYRQHRTEPAHHE
jgi:hypothetical protein